MANFVLGVPDLTNIITNNAVVFRLISLCTLSTLFGRRIFGPICRNLNKVTFACIMAYWHLILTSVTIMTNAAI